MATKRMPKQVIFLHIMKTAGTWFRHKLAETLPREQIAPVPLGRSKANPPYPYLPNTKERRYQLTVTPEQMQDYTLVMSHYDWRITERLPDWQIMAVFRHPVRQLLSMYRFLQRAKEHNIMSQAAIDLPFEQWVHVHGHKYANQQVTTLAGATLNLQQAIRNLHDERLTFGLVERMGESVALFNDRFGWSLPAPQERINASPNQAVDLDDATRAYVEALQAPDMALYKEACKLFPKQSE